MIKRSRSRSPQSPSSSPPLHYLLTIAYYCYHFETNYYYLFFLIFSIYFDCSCITQQHHILCWILCCFNARYEVTCSGMLCFILIHIFLYHYCYCFGSFLFVCCRFCFSETIRPIILFLLYGYLFCFETGSSFLLSIWYAFLQGYIIPICYTF